MTEERRAQIALLWLKNKFRQDGVRLKPDMRREIGSEAKKIGISTEEAMQFVESFVRELVEEMFPPRSVAVHTPEHTYGM